MHISCIKRIRMYQQFWATKRYHAYKRIRKSTILGNKKIPSKYYYDIITTLCTDNLDNKPLLNFDIFSQN